MFPWMPLASHRPPEAWLATLFSQFCLASSLSTRLLLPSLPNRWDALSNETILSYDRCQICLAKLWMTPTYKSFLTALTLCGYSSFLFGWHVHEKAILLVLVPLRFVFQVTTTAWSTHHISLSLLAAERHAYFRTFTIASVAGVVSLYPLLFTPAGKLFRLGRNSHWFLIMVESIVKVIYSTVWIAYVYISLSKRVYE